MGEAATWPRPGFCRPFSTNADLLAKLRAIKHPETIDYVFHAAALSDFQVAAVRDSAGVALKDAKIPSRGGNLTLELEPAVKIIGHLRALFPKAWIAGWKYELQGSREEAIARALAQIHENGTDASFVNGKAYGTGFGHVENGGLVRHFPDKASLCAGILAEKEGKAFPLPATGHLD
jgi:phosphopantothenoylcysteine decarboxylase/phosphopantothenate--cysteine ligase